MLLLDLTGVPASLRELEVDLTARPGLEPDLLRLRGEALEGSHRAGHISSTTPQSGERDAARD